MSGSSQRHKCKVVAADWLLWGAERTLQMTLEF